MPEYREVQIFHPGTKGTATVPETSLFVWYRSGWTLVTADPPPSAGNVPAPVTESEVEAARQKDIRDQAAADAKAASKPAASKSAKE